MELFIERILMYVVLIFFIVSFLFILLIYELIFNLGFCILKILILL